MSPVSLTYVIVGVVVLAVAGYMVYSAKKAKAQKPTLGVPTQVPTANVKPGQAVRSGEGNIKNS